MYKVQTIGDAYIAVTGMFGRDDGADGEGEWRRCNITLHSVGHSLRTLCGPPSSHPVMRPQGEPTAAALCPRGAGMHSTRRHVENALSIVNFAVAMLEEIAKVEPPNDKCDKLNMRLGIHVGRVVAGVIGTKKLRCVHPAIFAFPHCIRKDAPTDPGTTCGGRTCTLPSGWSRTAYQARSA